MKGASASGWQSGMTGEVVEWLMAAVLKTADGAEPFVGSNPTLPAMGCQEF